MKVKKSMKLEKVCRLKKYKGQESIKVEKVYRSKKYVGRKVLESK